MQASRKMVPVVPSIDLNLLSVLDALLQEGSVSGAARRLHVTSPAISRSLAKLRVHDVLAPAAHPPDAELEPTLDATFTVRAGPDNAQGFGPALVAQALARTRDVRVCLVEAGDGAVEALRDGRIDLTVGSPEPTGDEPVHRETLLTDRFVVVARVDGALAQTCRDRGPTVDELARVPHVSSSRRGLLHGPSTTGWPAQAHPHRPGAPLVACAGPGRRRAGRPADRISPIAPGRWRTPYGRTRTRPCCRPDRSPRSRRTHCVTTYSRNGFDDTN